MKYYIVTETSPGGGVTIDEPVKGIFETYDHALDKVVEILGYTKIDGVLTPQDGFNLADHILNDDSTPDDIFDVQAEPDVVLSIRPFVTQPVLLELTDVQANVLYNKLSWLMKECDGVDVWLAPGGKLDVNENPGEDDCFLNPDDPDVWELGNVTQKLGALLNK